MRKKNEEFILDLETVKALEELERKFVLEKAEKEKQIPIQHLNFLIGQEEKEVNKFYKDLEEKDIMVLY